MATRGEGYCRNQWRVHEAQENETHDGDLNWHFTYCSPRSEDKDSDDQRKPELLGDNECTPRTREVSRVLCVLKVGGDNEDPNKGQASPTGKTMVVLEDIMVSLADGRDSTEDRDRDCEGSNDSERQNNRVVERMIDKETVDSVYEPTQA